jgi:hypothetical protein
MSIDMGVRFKQKIVIGVYLGVLAGLFLPTGLALAATSSSSSLTTSPISVSLNDKPGQTTTTTLEVENNGTQPVSVGVQLKTFTASGDSGQAAIVSPVSSDTSLSWVHFSQTTFTALPGVFTPIQMTISLPKGADLGYYYAIIFRPILAVKSGANTNKFTLSNAILVLVDTGSSNEVRQLQVNSFTSSKKLYQYLPATFSVNIRNSGNIYVPPQGAIYISRTASGSNPIATLSINKSGGRVLPKSNRVFTAAWSSGFPKYEPELVAGQPLTKKNGQPIDKLVWNFADVDQFRFGKYYAHLTLVYNNGQRDIPIYGSVSFWVIPWKLLLIAFVLILIPVLFFIMALRYRRMYRKSRRLKQEK